MKNEEINAVIEVCLSKGWTVEGTTHKALMPPDHRRNWCAQWFKSEHGIAVPHWAWDELSS